jgi:hypothetical protein
MISGRNIAWEGTQNPLTMAGRAQNPAGRYPKDALFLLVIQDVIPLPTVQNIHPADRLDLADPPQISLSGFQILVPQDDL